MAAYTHLQFGTSAWPNAMGATYDSYTASVVTIINTDGTLTRAHGAFVIFNGALIGGAITSLERTSPDNAVVYEKITGLSYLLNAFLNAPAKDRIPNVLSGQDSVIGTSGKDDLDGFNGADSMVGGGGDDTYRVGAGDTVTETWNGGDDDWVYTALSQYTLPAYVENLANSNTPFHGIGNGGDNTFHAFHGQAKLEGRDGNDIFYAQGNLNHLIGGKGDDTYVIDTYTGTITEKGGEGFDTVETDVNNFKLPDFVEALQLKGAASVLTGYGNQHNNVIHGTWNSDILYGMDGSDKIYGEQGVDTLIGGDGDDRYFVDDLGDTIIEELDEGYDTVETSRSEFTLATNVEQLIFVDDIAHVGHGNDLDNYITGAGENDELYGYDGKDHFVGKAGADTMTGGAGDDIYEVDDSGDVIVELEDEGFDQVWATSASYTLSANVEDLIFNGVATHLGHGNDLDNRIDGDFGQDTFYGYGGNDTFAGYTGGDTFYGGVGDDFYHVSNGDSVVELTNEGIDTISAVEKTYTLPDNIENLEHWGTIGIGNELDNDLRLIFNAATELRALGGNDTLRMNVHSNALAHGGAGDDTVVLPGALVDWSILDRGDKVILKGKFNTHIEAVAAEHLQFDDGTIHFNDGNMLFDTLYYMSHNPDVFHAGVNALDHFNAIGWQEGRDPNAFFDTSGYLAANPGVAGSGMNPLDHYHQFGWQAGRDPGSNFDTKLYLVNNPDVAAAGMDPLLHYLQFGMGEGRQAYAAIGQNITNGFDAEYYLFHNPDVAAAGIDPLFHFNVVGWKEGRDPNAWFDSDGYLAHYKDVAAAGINPLQHYQAVGWMEGRDASAGFDTTGYLAAYPDVAAAGMNPLDHFLQFGIYEGRQAVNDGVWG